MEGKGGEWSFAGVCAKVSYAQEAGFAGFCKLPTSTARRRPLSIGPEAAKVQI